MRKTGLYLLIIMLSLPVYSYCSGILLPWSAEGAAVNNSILVQNAVSNFTINPATGNAGCEVSTLRLYNISELSIYNFSAVWNFASLSTGLALSSLDHCSYNENSAILNCKYKLYDLSLGINYQLYHVKISGKGSRSRSAVDLGVIWFCDKFSSAFSCNNLNLSEMHDLQIPSCFIWEIAYSIEEQINIDLKLEKEEELDFQPSIATSINVNQFLNILASFSENPSQTGLGFSVSMFRWQVSYGVQYHPELNLSHFISIRYEKNITDTADSHQ